MTPILEPSGRHVGWFDAGTIRGLHHRTCARVVAGKILTQDKAVIGEFDGVFFRDLQSLPVAFLWDGQVEEFIPHPCTPVVFMPTSVAPFCLSFPASLRVWSVMNWYRFLGVEPPQ